MSPDITVDPGGRVERGDNAVRSVEPSSQWLAVQVGSGEHTGRPLEPAVGGVLVPEAVDCDGHPQFPGTAAEPGTDIPVLLRPRLPVDSSRRRGAVAGGVVKICEETLIGGVFCHDRSLSLVRLVGASPGCQSFSRSKCKHVTVMRTIVTLHSVSSHILCSEHMMRGPEAEKCRVPLGVMHYIAQRARGTVRYGRLRSGP